MLALATRRAGRELRCEARGQEQLEPEGERLRPGGRGGLVVEDPQLAAEQVVRGGIGLLRVEQAEDRVAGLGRALDGVAALPQRGMRVDGLRRGDGVELTAALVEDQVDAEERLEPAAESRLDAPHALRDRAYPAALAAVEVKDPIGLSVADRAQHDRLGLEAGRHVSAGGLAGYHS